MNRPKPQYILYIDKDHPSYCYKGEIGVMTDNSHSEKREDIYTLLKPESDLERRVITDMEFLKGASSGEPRPGHPEGKVKYHIKEVLDNVDKYAPDEVTRTKLRLIAFIHDTFKYKVDVTQPKTGENHHAMIARRFAEKYIADPDILDVIELHDEAYNAWCKGFFGGKWEKAAERCQRLIDRLGTNVDLFLLFYICDNETGDKSQANIQWFKTQLLCETSK